MDTTPARVIREVGTTPSPQQLLEKATGIAANFGWNIKVCVLFHWGEYEPGALLCVLFFVRDCEESSLMTGWNQPVFGRLISYNNVRVANNQALAISNAA